MSGAGDMTRVSYETWFWHAGHPLDVKFEIEKAAAMLLARDAAAVPKLVFTGTSGSRDPAYHGRLCLEAAGPERHLYSLQLEAAAQSKWFTEEKMRGLYSDKAWAHWTRNLQAAPAGTSADSSAVLYDRLVAETVAREREAAAHQEDPAPIAALRQEILAALRAGKRLGNSDKEGLTTFAFDGAHFVRRHVGDWDENRVFASADEMLADLRAYYDWDTKRATYPHRPPEADAWRLIKAKLW